MLKHARNGCFDPALILRAGGGSQNILVLGLSLARRQHQERSDVILMSELEYDTWICQHDDSPPGTWASTVCKGDLRTGPAMQ